MRKPVLYAFLAAAAAAMVLPGGIALSNYSGPYAKTVTLLPPYDSATQSRFNDCQALMRCSESTDADAHTGRLESGILIETPLGGAAPTVLGSGTDARSELHIHDPFEDGAHADHTLYRVFAHIDRVTYETSSLQAPWADTYLTASAPGTVRYTYESLPRSKPTDVIITAQVDGPVYHGLDLTVTLDSYGYADTLSIGHVRSEGAVTVTKIERIY